MLQIKNVKKKYTTGTLVQTALDGVSLDFRDNEFVAILGPSGSGKTTLLNIIGGLDRYDSGDLIINGISTKKYKDSDWDSYRNHTIGFVFQSYNLIPHQTVLSNVELALTISGISRGERRKRATEALEKVGLGEQLHKRPNQMSGGQMQRVAIARALVNNPDILLADEPTGALDTETSIQVMELLKEIAKDKLVIMVTHNPELAEQYATRIVKLRDGKIIDDTDTKQIEENIEVKEYQNMGKSSMSFLTSLSLSFNNLRTKKGRTILTAIAGSIGIIGIALILSLSTGVNNYITDIQKETMTSYPITIESQSIDMSSMINVRNDVISEKNEDKKVDESKKGVYSNNTFIEHQSMFTSSFTKNNLTEFKKYLDNPDSKIHDYLGDNGIVYSYDVKFNVFSYDEEGSLINTDTETDLNNINSSSTGMLSSQSSNPMKGMSVMMGMSSGSGAQNFTEIMSGKGDSDSTVSQVVLDNYDMLYGAWPKNYDEVVLVLDNNNSISTDTLYQLGLITLSQYKEVNKEIEKGDKGKVYNWNYEDILKHNFYLIPSCAYYEKNENGTFDYIGDNELKIDSIINKGVKLKIAGVIRPKDDAKNASINTAVGYTSLLTQYIIDYTDNSEVVKAQENDKNVSVLTGLNFESLDDNAKISDTKKYMSALSDSEKAKLYMSIMSYQSNANQSGSTTENNSTENPSASQNAQSSIPSNMGAAMSMDETTMAKAMDAWLANSPDNQILLSFYDNYLTGNSYDDNMSDFGKVSFDAPSSINIYADSFDDKDAISNCISDYNSNAKDDDKITYTDFVALMTSSITSIVDVITYILVAFVAVSLVVSSIMIGIITHISVLERTKEIGILRAIGASKRNISQMFNAETIIIGFFSGLVGVVFSALLTLPINAIIASLLGTNTVKAVLPIKSAVILVIISMVITVIGGLMPAKKAAKKDPVIALRTE